MGKQTIEWGIYVVAIKKTVNFCRESQETISITHYYIVLRYQYYTQLHPPASEGPGDVPDGLRELRGGRDRLGERRGRGGGPHQPHPRQGGEHVLHGRRGLPQLPPGGDRRGGAAEGAARGRLRQRRRQHHRLLPRQLPGGPGRRRQHQARGGSRGTATTGRTSRSRRPAATRPTPSPPSPSWMGGLRPSSPWAPASQCRRWRGWLRWRWLQDGVLQDWRKPCHLL